MPFATPMVWREQKDHSSDCYFCMTDIKGYTSKNKKLIMYPDVPSAMKPVPHDEFLPVPNPPADPDILQQSSDDASTDSSSLLCLSGSSDAEFMSKNHISLPKKN